MSNQINQDENNNLDALYQRRKHRHNSPDAVKAEFLAKLAHQNNEQTPWWKADFSQYFKISAFALTAALAFLVVGTHLITQQQISPALTSSANQYLSVEFHVLEKSDTMPSKGLVNTSESLLANNSAPSDGSTIMNDATQRQISYKQAQTGYKNKQRKLQMHHQTYARVVQSDDGLSLLTCEQELLNISQEVLELLLPDENKRTINFQKGNMLALGFDERGHIVEMRKQSLKNQC